jgi:YVTN family beta-propeller protein
MISVGHSGIAAIPLREGPVALAIAPNGRHLYTANAAGSLSVIDTESNRVTATVQIDGFPVRVAVSPDGREVYCVNASGSISVIDSAAARVIRTVRLPGWPQGIALTPDGTHAYLTDFGGNTVSVIALRPTAVTDGGRPVAFGR